MGWKKQNGIDIFTIDEGVAFDHAVAAYAVCDLLRRQKTPREQYDGAILKDFAYCYVRWRWLDQKQITIIQRILKKYALMGRAIRTIEMRPEICERMKLELKGTKRKKPKAEHYFPSKRHVKKKA